MDRTFRRLRALLVRTGTIGVSPFLWAGLTLLSLPARLPLAGGITCNTALRGGTITIIAARIQSTTGGEPRRGTASAVSIQRIIGQMAFTMITVRTLSLATTLTCTSTVKE